MFSVNEVGCIVPGAMKRRHGLQASSSSSSAAAVVAAVLTFLPQKTVTENFVRRLIFIFNSVCTSWVRREERGRGVVHRKTVSGSGSYFYCNLSKCYALFSTYLPQISDWFVAALAWQQLWKMMIVLFAPCEKKSYRFCISCSSLCISFAKSYSDVKHTGETNWTLLVKNKHWAVIPNVRPTVQH